MRWSRKNEKRDGDSLKEAWESPAFQGMGGESGEADLSREG